MEKVSLIRCDRYHAETVRQGLEQALAPFGGVKGFVKKGQRVLLKPNLLAAASPAEAVTTHPLIVSTVAKMIREAGAEVYIGDSPGSDQQEKAMAISGLTSVIEEGLAKILLLKETRMVKLPLSGKMVPLAAELDQVDLMINLAKLKTHSLTGLTGAVKNLYGCIPGNAKKRFHLEYPLPLDFSRLLVDLALLLKPALSIIDAVVAMEGAGPRRGKPRQSGLIIASPNAIAADLVAAAVTGFATDEVATLAVARSLNLPGSELTKLDITGLTLNEARIRAFDRGPAATGKIGALLAALPLAFIRNHIAARRPYPQLNRELCNGCRVCLESCPVQVITFNQKLPKIELSGCIRCYCCQELCAQGAVDLKRRL